MQSPVPAPGHPDIRSMRSDEIEATLDLFEAVAAERVWMGTEPGFDRESRAANWRTAMTDPTARLLVLVEPGGDRLLGQGYVHVARYGVAEIGMFLRADARGRGLGGRLLDAMVAAADELGAHKVELQVWPHNEAALRLYQSRGFVVEGRIRAHYRRASGELWDAILMGLVRDPASVRSSGLPDAPGLPASIPITP